MQRSHRNEPAPIGQPLRRRLRTLVLAASLAAAISAPASAITLVYASWSVDGNLVPFSAPQQVVSDSPGIEYRYGAGTYRLKADFTETSLAITQDNHFFFPLPSVPAWTMSFYFNTSDWLDGLSLERQSFGSGLTWTMPASNHLEVSWAGGALPRRGLTAEFATAVPEPSTALLVLGGLALLAPLRRRPA